MLSTLVLITDHDLTLCTARGCFANCILAADKKQVILHMWHYEYDFFQCQDSFNTEEKSLTWSAAFVKFSKTLCNSFFCMKHLQNDPDNTLCMSQCKCQYFNIEQAPE